jgi:hypothetical protein
LAFQVWNAAARIEVLFEGGDMLLPRIGTLFGLLLFPLTVAAQEKEFAPSGFPPSVGTAKALLRDGKVFIEVTAVTITPYVETRVIERDGKKVTESKARYQPLTIKESFLLQAKDAVIFGKDGKSIERVLFMNQAKVYRKDGKEVNLQEIPKLFKSERPVVIFGTSKLDPYYLRVIHDDVLVITCARNLVFPRNDEEMNPEE